MGRNLLMEKSTTFDQVVLLLCITLEIVAFARTGKNPGEGIETNSSWNGRAETKLPETSSPVVLQ